MANLPRGAYCCSSQTSDPSDLHVCKCSSPVAHTHFYVCISQQMVFVAVLTILAHRQPALTYWREKHKFPLVKYPLFSEHWLCSSEPQTNEQVLVLSCLKMRRILSSCWHCALLESRLSSVFCSLQSKRLHGGFLDWKWQAEVLKAAFLLFPLGNKPPVQLSWITNSFGWV